MNKRGVAAVTVSAVSLCLSDFLFKFVSFNLICYFVLFHRGEVLAILASKWRSFSWVALEFFFSFLFVFFTLFFSSSFYPFPLYCSLNVHSISTFCSGYVVYAVSLFFLTLSLAVLIKLAELFGDQMKDFIIQELLGIM